MEIPQAAIEAAESFAVSDVGPIVEQTWDREAFKGLLSAALPALREQWERELLDLLSDRWGYPSGNPNQGNYRDGFLAGLRYAEEVIRNPSDDQN